MERLLLKHKIFNLINSSIAPKGQRKFFLRYFRKYSEISGKFPKYNAFLSYFPENFLCKWINFWVED